MLYVVYISIIVCNICGAYIYTGKGRHRWSKLKSCNGHQNSRRSYYGMGNGFPYKCAKRYTGNKQKKLVVFDFIRISYRSVVAMLL